MKQIFAIVFVGICVVVIMACQNDITPTKDIQATIDASVVSGIKATREIEAKYTPTPNIDATVQIQVQRTLQAEITATPVSKQINLGDVNEIASAMYKCIQMNPQFKARLIQQWSSFGVTEGMLNNYYSFRSVMLLGLESESPEVVSNLAKSADMIVDGCKNVERNNQQENSQDNSMTFS